MRNSHSTAAGDTRRQLVALLTWVGLCLAFGMVIHILLGA